MQHLILRNKRNFSAEFSQVAQKNKKVKGKGTFHF